ncbi:MAG: hypothetical protein Q9159_000867 [Coniocarpon cinnabarinum]
MAPLNLKPAKSAEEYRVGWVCALPEEQTAATRMLDQRHKPLHNQPRDTNVYTYGSIGEHNVVIASLPGTTGTNAAAAVAVQMVQSFHNVKIGLLVGIGGGVPSARNDIRLGDVVVSKPDQQSGGVIQWDKGKVVSGQDAFVRTGSLNEPPKILLGAAQTFITSLELEESSFSEHLASAPPAYQFPADEQDQLFRPDYPHVDPDSIDCSECDLKQTVERKARRDATPQVHQGLIASGNKVIKNGAERDKIVKSLGRILCFEMEAAGLMNDFECLVVRGISDYSDSHKNDGWHRYAAATAAACAKEILLNTPLADLDTMKPLADQLQRQMADIEVKISTQVAEGFAGINARDEKNKARKHRTEVESWLVRPEEYLVDRELPAHFFDDWDWFQEEQSVGIWTKGTTPVVLKCIGDAGVGKVNVHGTLLKNDDPGYVSPAMEELWQACNSGDRATQDQLLELLSSELGRVQDRDVYIILDGLEEVAEDKAAKLQEILEGVQHNATRSNVRLAIFSRNNKDILRSDQVVTCDAKDSGCDG